MENNVFTGEYKRRKRKDLVFRAAILVPTGIVISLLILILAQVVVNGSKALNLDFFFSNKNPSAKWAEGLCRRLSAPSWYWLSRLS